MRMHKIHQLPRGQAANVWRGVLPKNQTKTKYKPLMVVEDDDMPT